MAQSALEQRLTKQRNKGSQSAQYAAYEAVMLIGGVVLVVDPMNEQVAGLYREFGFNSVEGSGRMALNFREFNKGTPL